MKRFTILSLAILFSVLVNAQKVSGGLSFSPILSWTKSDSKLIENDGNRFSVGYGIFADYNFTENFSLSSGININEVGGTVKYPKEIGFLYEDVYDTLPTGARVFYKIRYVEIPISLKGKTNEIGYFTYFMKAGLSPMFRWKVRGDIYQTIDSKEVKIEDVNMKNEVNWFSLSFHVGAGLEYSLGGNTALVAELIYYNGLTDFTNDNSYKEYDKNMDLNADYRNTYSVLTHQFMLKIGIKF